MVAGAIRYMHMQNSLQIVLDDDSILCLPADLSNRSTAAAGSVRHPVVLEPFGATDPVTKGLI